MLGKLKEAKEKKEQMGMAADSAKIMANAMRNNKGNIAKAYQEGRKEVMEKHGEEIIENRANMVGKMAGNFVRAHGHGGAAIFAERMAKMAAKSFMTKQEKNIKLRA